ncbi:MAG: oxygenase MpaB family protein [Saprospiraceae bacterium]
MTSNDMGYFGPTSITWQLYRESLTLTGGVRALLLQVAHPAVADGVARFSNFKTDPLGRGYRTFAAMAMIYFGSKTQAEQTAQRLWRMHSTIQGEGPNAYSANDPHLLLWVLATLTDTTLQVHKRMPLPDLPPDWQERFYEESKVAARLLGIPESVYPADLQAFEQYFRSMLEGDLLGSTDTCRQVAQSIILHPKAPKKLANLLATGWLPAPLCTRLGIPVSIEATAKLERFLRRYWRVYRLIPKALRWSPAYHQAHYRIAIAQGESPTWAGRFFHWRGKRVKTPMGLGNG